LQGALLDRYLLAIGIDESAQMGRLARRNLTRFFPSKAKPSSHQPSVYTQAQLTRGVSQYLPFSNDVFDTIVATFPSEYIFDPQTLIEVQRVLTENGQFVILPGATIMGRGILDRAMALLFRITGETSPNLSEILHERSKTPFAEAGFHVEIHELDIKSSLVFIMVAVKDSPKG
jgi:ubiquinone/menaquinone biosynthesis C-methylase UbiE